MTDLPTIGDHRWEGYNPNDLVEVVKQVKSGPGAAAMNPAMDALKAASQVVADMDATLRKQLGELGIEWQSTAGQQAQATVTQSADYAGEADSKLTTSAQAVDTQGSSHSFVKNTLPDPKILSYDRHYQNGFGDGVQHFFGYETDHDKQVKAANSAKAVVVQQMNAYAENSRTNLAAYQPLAAAPAINVQAEPISGPSGSSVAGPTLGQPGYGPGMVTIGGAGGGGVGIGGWGASPGGPVGGTPGGGAPGGVGDGGRVGVGPTPGGTGGNVGGLAPGRVGGGGGGGFNVAAGAGAVLSAGAGIGAGAAALTEGRGGLGRSGRGPTGGVPGNPEGSAPSGRGQGPGGRGQGPAGTLGVGAEEEGAAGRPGRLATGGAAGRGSSPMMQPAAMTKGDGEEDKEHIRKYAVESSEVFDDERLVVPTVIGDTDAPQEQPQQQEQEQQPGTEPQ